MNFREYVLLFYGCRITTDGHRWPSCLPLVSQLTFTSSTSRLPVSFIMLPDDGPLTDTKDLDSEQRIIASRVIKRFIMHAKKTAFIVEHDFIMATYLADRVIVFDGQPGIDAHANKPESLLTGCNTFLKNLNVTFRRDPTNFRPRINKLDSQLDQEQKLNGNYVSPLPSFGVTSHLLNPWHQFFLEDLEKSS